MSLHSIVLGIAVYFLTNYLLVLQELYPSGNGSLFYPRQAGVFLVILGIAYALAAGNPDRRKSMVFLSIFSKAIAILFLFTEIVVRGAPPVIIAAGVGDALFGIVALCLTLMYYRETRAAA